MATTTQYRLNLVVDKKMQEILAYFKAKYPLLKDVDIIKMAVGGFYSNEIAKLPVHTLSKDGENSLKQSMQARSKGDPTFDDIDKLMEYLDN